jgi:acyl-CoA hydrolase
MLTARERREALIAIAHPDFRAALRDGAPAGLSAPGHDRAHGDERAASLSSAA